MTTQKSILAARFGARVLRRHGTKVAAAAAARLMALCLDMEEVLNEAVDAAHATHLFASGARQGTPNFFQRYQSDTKLRRTTMPVIFLWGIPALIVLGGGAYWIVHLHH